MNEEAKTKTTYALSEECKRLLLLLAMKLGVNRTAIIELAVREKAHREGVQ